MNKITTYNGIKLLLVEIPKDATYISKYNLQISYRLPNEGYIYVKDIPISNCEIIGTTSTLTNEQVEPFVEKNEFNNYCNYNNKSNIKNKFCFNCSFTALESFNSLLEVNNIDTSKEYVILKLLNNE